MIIKKQKNCLSLMNRINPLGQVQHFDAKNFNFRILKKIKKHGVCNYSEHVQHY